MPVVGADWVIVTGFTVSAKVHEPVSPSASEVAPVTVWVPAVRVPLVWTAPVEETMTWVESGDVFSANATVPGLPAVASWLVKLPDAVVVVMPAVDPDWVIVTAFTVSA